MAQPTKGFMLTLTHEAVLDLVREAASWLPKDAVFLKAVPAHGSYYGFDFLFTSESGFEIAEGTTFPRISGEDELPERREE